MTTMEDVIFVFQSVKSAGVVVGRVESIAFVDNKYQANVRLSLDRRYVFPKDSSLKMLQMNKGKFSNVVVVGTGYNDLDDANFARAVREITKEAKLQGVQVLWLTYRQAGNVRMKSVSYNRQLFELEKMIDNLHILRWCDISNGHPEWFTADSVHMNATGGLALAKAISAAIGQLTTT